MGEIKIVVQIKGSIAASRTVAKGKISPDNIAMALTHLELRKKKLIEEFERRSTPINSSNKELLHKYSAILIQQ